MTTDIHTQVTLENWGFLAEIGEWGTLEKAVSIYLEQNPPLIYPTEANTKDLSHPALALNRTPTAHQNDRSIPNYVTNAAESRLSGTTNL